MNGYDFDNTLYRGESPFDFFFFCLKKKKSLIKYVPTMILCLIQYKRKKLKIEELLETAENIIQKIFSNKEELINYVEKFWEKNSYKLKMDLIKQIKTTDIIITASPRFLVEKIIGQLHTSNLICTEYNLETNKIEFVCYKENKVQKFKELYPNTVLDAFYTDSLNDLAMMNFSKKAYLVKGDKIQEYKEKTRL